jgi:hypothetical protein
LVVVICVIAGAAYMGYRVVNDIIAFVCTDCTYQNNGGSVIRGSGNVTTEARPVGPFTSINLASSGKVVVERTGAVSLSLTADDNLLPLFISEVKGDTLYLSVAKGKSIQGKIPIYRVTVADFHGIRIEGSGDVTATRLDGDALTVAIAGAGDVRVAGRADDLTFSISGSGSLDAAQLQAKRAKVAIAGSGNATVNASDTLDARISGSGDVTYIGAPQVTSHVAGSGSIKRKQ